ncbi:homeodomain superfamily [Paramecium bursaria]
MRTLKKIHDYKQQRQQILIQKIQQLEVALILFQKGYISEDSEKKSQNDLISNDIYDKVKTIKAFIDKTKNTILQENLLIFQTQDSIQKIFDHMGAMLTHQIKLYKEKLQFYKEKEGNIRGHKFSRKANLILKEWLCDNFQYPYPEQEDLILLSQKCKLTYKQVFNPNIFKKRFQYGLLTVEEELLKRPTTSINIRILLKKGISIQRAINETIFQYFYSY